MSKLKLGVFEDDDSYDGLCGCGYRTSGWPIAEIAEKRLKQHGMEHYNGTPMQGIEQFREENGLVSDGVKAVMAADIQVDFDPESEGD